MNVTWPALEGAGNLTCDGSYSCAEVNFPRPDANDPLLITCDSNSECQASTIYCPSNASCIINCMAESSCDNVCQIIHLSIINRQLCIVIQIACVI